MLGAWGPWAAWTGAGTGELKLILRALALRRDDWEVTDWEARTAGVLGGV